MLRMPNMTHTTLPNLYFFSFGGVSAYLEALLSHMNAPVLRALSVSFFNQLSFSIPHLRQFVVTTGIFRSSKVKLLFYHKEVVAFMFFFLFFF